jgi:hypothetical protein
MNRVYKYGALSPEELCKRWLKTCQIILKRLQRLASRFFGSRRCVTCKNVVPFRSDRPYAGRCAIWGITLISDAQTNAPRFHWYPMEKTGCVYYEVAP